MGLTGLLGGTFDPPHNGHVALARAALERFRLERLVVMVAGRPPQKTATLDPETRFRLAAVAFEDVPLAELSRHDLDRPGVAYTIDTVRYAQREWGEIVLLIGADQFAGFLAWREPDAILERARLGVATRPGVPEERHAGVLRALARPDRVDFFDMPPVDISSSEVRRHLEAGDPVGSLVPPAVASLLARRRRPAPEGVSAARGYNSAQRRDPTEL